MNLRCYCDDRLGAQIALPFLPFPFASIRPYKFVQTNISRHPIEEEHLSHPSHPLPQSQQILYRPPQHFRRRRPPSFPLLTCPALCAVCTEKGGEEDRGGRRTGVNRDVSLRIDAVERRRGHVLSN